MSVGNMRDGFGVSRVGGEHFRLNPLTIGKSLDTASPYYGQ